jgi:hypothetical protein
MQASFKFGRGLTQPSYRFPTEDRIPGIGLRLDRGHGKHHFPILRRCCTMSCDYLVFSTTLISNSMGKEAASRCVHCRSLKRKGKGGVSVVSLGANAGHLGSHLEPAENIAEGKHEN